MQPLIPPVNNIGHYSEGIKELTNEDHKDSVPTSVAIICVTIEIVMGYCSSCDACMAIWVMMNVM